MSKHNKKTQSNTPKPSELLGKTSTPVEETPVVVEATPEPTAVVEPKAQPSLADIVANLPEEIRGKALAELEKLVSQGKRNEQAKQFAEFNNALTDKEKGVAKWLETLAETHKVSLAGRKITVVYPLATENGKVPSVSNVPKGSKGNGSGGTREGFPTGWGETELVKEGKVVQKEKSPSALAKSLGLQITGMRTMVDVFENPHEVDTKAELPKIYTVDAVKGEHFRVAIK